MADTERQHADPVRHLIEVHGYTQGYFDQFDRPLSEDEIRFLHEPYVRTREYPEGCAL